MCKDAHFRQIANYFQFANIRVLIFRLLAMSTQYADGLSDQTSVSATFTSLKKFKKSYFIAPSVFE